MKFLILFFVVTTLAFSGCTLVAMVDDPVPGPAPPASGDKVAVCHKGKKTLYIPPAAVKAHLKHGDYRGVCR